MGYSEFNKVNKSPIKRASELKFELDDNHKRTI
jgi:hypothetical protein